MSFKAKRTSTTLETSAFDTLTQGTQQVSDIFKYYMGNTFLDI